MRAQHVRININLIPRDPFFGTVIGRALKWTLSVGRYIVIFTELVVIMSFASRFTLDRQVTDLNEAINQKQMVLQSYGSLESEFRVIQKKLENISQLQTSNNLVEIFPRLTKIMPIQVRLNELTVNQTNVIMSGTVPNQEILQKFMNNIQLSPDFANISVGKIDAQGEKVGGYSFELTADVVQPKASPTK